MWGKPTLFHQAKSIEKNIEKRKNAIPNKKILTILIDFVLYRNKCPGHLRRFLGLPMVNNSSLLKANSTTDVSTRIFYDSLSLLFLITLLNNFFLHANPQQP